MFSVIPSNVQAKVQPSNMSSAQIRNEAELHH